MPDKEQANFFENCWTNFVIHDSSGKVVRLFRRMNEINPTKTLLWRHFSIDIYQNSIILSKGHLSTPLASSGIGGEALI